MSHLPSSHANCEASKSLIFLYVRPCVPDLPLLLVTATASFRSGMIDRQNERKCLFDVFFFHDTSDPSISHRCWDGMEAADFWFGKGWDWTAIGNKRWQFARVATNPMTSCALHEYFYGFFQMRSIILNVTFYLGMPLRFCAYLTKLILFETMSIESRKFMFLLLP